ncbi:MAG TPA: hypothetical protein VEF33_11520, partial [Syntrophales bacterium]|nr:hypothetical protein [Syntrophales bacterium]
MKSSALYRKTITIIMLLGAGIFVMTQAAHADADEVLQKLKETKECQGCDLSRLELSGASLFAANLT